MPAPPPPPAPAGPGRFRRALGALGAGVGFALVFASALVVSVVVHLDLAPTRRVVRTIANGILGTTFKGAIVVGEIDRLSLHGITVRSATALDPSGAEVARIEGLRADTDVLGIVKSASTPELRVLVPLIHIDNVDVTLDRGEGGGIGISETFLLRNPKPPNPNAVPPRVSLSRIEIDHVRAHGAIAPPASLDAEIHYVRASVDVAPDGVKVHVAPVRLEAHAPVPKPLTGDVTFDLRVPPARAGGDAAPPHIEAGFEGMLGDLDLRLAASLEDKHVAARIEVPRATPEVIASFLPDRSTELPLRAPVSLVVVAEGDLPDIAVDAYLDLDEAGSIDVNGGISAKSPFGLDLGFRVNRLDPRVALDVPQALPLDASGRVKLSLGEQTAIEIDAATKPLAIGKVPIPGVMARAKLERGVWSGSAEVDEPGAPTKATFSRDKAGVVRFEVNSDARSLRTIPRLAGAPLDGAAHVEAKGTFDKGALDVKVSGRVSGFRTGGLALDDTRLDAHIEGPPDKLSVRRAKVHGRGMRAGRYSWETIDVDASGPLKGSMQVEAFADAGGGESVKLEATALPLQKSVRDVELTLKRKTGEIKGKVEQVSVGPRGIQVDKLALHGDGIGDLHGDLRLQGPELVGTLRGRDVNLARVGSIAGVPLPVTGLANIDVDLTSSRPGERRGHIAVEFANVRSPALKDAVSGVEHLSASGSLIATFEGDRVRIDSLGRLVEHASPKDRPDQRCDGAIAAVRVSDGRGVIPGPLLEPATWKRISGELTIAAENWNLRCLERHSPLPLPLDVRGKVTTRATIALAPGARLPAVKGFVARTRGLGVDGGEDFPWNSNLVDVEIKGAFDPASGKVEASVALEDTRTIGSLSARTTIDAEAFLAHPKQRQAMLEDAPLSIQLSIPRRAIAAFGSLPPAVRDHLPPVTGDVEIKGSIEGSINAPLVKIDGQAWDIGIVGQRANAGATKDKAPPQIEDTPWYLPTDHVDTLTYDGKKLVARTRIVHEDREIAAANAELTMPIADVRAGSVAPKGYVELTFTRAPLGDLPFFSDRGVKGNLSGKVAMTGLGEAPSIKADLGIPDLKIHDLAYDEASIQLDVRQPRGPQAVKNRGSATAAFTMQGKTRDKSNRFEARAFAEVLWKNGLVPVPDTNRPAKVRVEANDFRIAALGPFVAGVFSSIDGKLNGKAAVGFTRLDDDKSATIEAQLALTQGALHIPQLGQELRNVELALKGGGSGVLLLDKLRADGQKGRITGSGSARFKGLDFTKADAVFEIKEGQELPITLEGVPLGDARGKVTVHADKRGDTTEIRVGIPSFFLALPVSTGRGVQALDGNPDIVIEQEAPREKKKKEEERPKSASRLAIKFDLGDIGLKGNLGVVNMEVDVGMSGVKSAPLEVVTGDKAQVSGDIQLTRGRIVLLKRTFEIDRGVVHMRPEDPGNPYLNVVARWDSPNGEIFIEYVGVLLPFTKDKIKLRSPKLSETEIVATLLSGGAKQQSSGPTSDVGAGTGQAIAQQLIAQQFSQQIAGGISTSLGTSDDGAVRPGLVYTSGDKVIELSTYGATGQSAGGGAALKGQRTQITVDWRFWRNWSLRGRVDAGSDQTLTGVDLLWQYRY